MRGVEPAFERLQPVAILEGLRDVAMRRGYARPFEIGRAGLMLLGSHIGPDDAAALDRRIGFDLDAVLHRAGRRLARQIDTSARRIELPAVIDAAQAAFLVAAEEQRRAPMRAISIDEADRAVAVAEGDEVLAQKPYADRRAIALGQFARQSRRLPIASHQIAHGRPRADAADLLVVLVLEHGWPRSKKAAGTRAPISYL